MKNTELIAIDVFAGAGGLSLGVKQAGFSVKAAVESNQAFAPTYRKNFPDTILYQQDVRSVRGEDLFRATSGKQPDLLMGCAPCQGFCSLTKRQNDPRNALVSELGRLIDETRPRMVFMENVPRLASRGRRIFTKFLNDLKRIGYQPNWWIVQMADYGIPQSRRRLVLLAGHGFAVNLPETSHSNPQMPKEGTEDWRTLRDSVFGEKAPLKLSEARRRKKVLRNNWHVVRDLSPVTRSRLKESYAGGLRTDLPSSLLPDCHQDGYQGFRNVYTRMTWDAVSPTITAGFTTPAKGRFGHPDRRRTTISVREGATIQTFPKSFRFATERIEVACQMIGNAVPPLFARKVGKHLQQFLQ